MKFRYLDLEFKIMIIILHGDDIVSSRNYYKTLHKPHGETYEGEKLTLDAIEEALQSTGLFRDEKEIYIENFFSKRKSSKEMLQIITALNAVNDQTTIVFWESKELPKKTTDQLTRAQIKSFSIPKSLFLFIDSIKPHNTAQMLTLYHQTLQHTDAEMIFVMLIRQIRLLLAFSDTTSNTIEELKRMAFWQQKKLMIQARQFSQKELANIHAALFDLEVKSKTGGLTLPLSQSIDFFLLSI